jgi:signal transduction histidine kinase
VSVDLTLASSWNDECLIRERGEYFLTLVAAAVIFPGYFVADLCLEPGLPAEFAIARALGSVVLIVAVLAMRRARSLASARAWFSIPIIIACAVVAAFLPRVEHYEVYLIGYSMFFWGTFILSWPVWLALVTFGCHLLLVAVMFFVFAGQRTVADSVSAALFLTSASALTCLSSYARRKAHAREFVISHKLADRNSELAGALTNLRDAQSRLVAHEKLSALGRMLAGLSHEMNNPVNVLKNNVEPVREHVEVLLGLVDMARSPEGRQALDAAWE